MLGRDGLGHIAMEIDLQIVYGILLATKEKHNFVIDELELPCHFFVDVIDLIHRANGPVNSLEVGQVLMKGAFQASFFLTAQSTLLSFSSLS